MDGADLRREHRALLNDLIEYRLNKGITQAMVARRAGVPRPSISVLESCQRNPGLLNLIRYADALGVEITFTEKRR